MTAVEMMLELANRAQERYGDFASTHEALGVASEEWDELKDAIRANDLVQVRYECIDLAAVLLRLALAVENGGAFSARSVK